MIRFPLSLLLAVVALGPLCAASGPGEVPGGLSGEVAARIESVLDVVYSPIAEGPEALARREDEVRRALGETLGYQGMIRRAVGRHWGSFSDAQKAELEDLLVRLLVRAYISRFGAGERPRLEYRPATVLAPNRHEVPSVAILGGQRFSLAYRLIELEGRREVYDVVIEGVSLVGNYRDQIDAHFQRGDAEALLAKLRQQLAGVGAPRAQS